MELKKTPGPGTYVPRTYIGEGPKIGIKSRVGDSTFGVSKVPGPGTYQPNFSSVLYKPPNVGLGHERRDNIINRSDNIKFPGPGAYPLLNKSEGPKFGFGREKRSAERYSDVPGPGRYDIATTIGDLPPHEKSKHT